MILALLLTWVLNPTNCDGTPTNDIRWFRVQYMTRTCWDFHLDNPQCELPILQTQEVDYWTTSLRIDLPLTPIVGQMIYWRVDQVDGARNTSEACE